VTDKVRVLVVETGVVRRQFLAEVLAGVPDVEVAGVAATGRIALARLAQTPVDLVLFDVGLDPADVKKMIDDIHAGYPDVGLVPMAGQDSAHASMVIGLLEMGALDLLPRPDPGSAAERHEFQGRIEALLRAFLGRRHVRLARRLTEARRFQEGPPVKTDAAARAAKTSAKPVPVPKTAIRPALSRPPVRIDVVVIGISTGGPNALAEVIPRLDADLGVPVLLVQHMPPLFTEALAASLDRKAAIRVREAVDGEDILPNRVYLAPGGRHMVVRETTAATGPRARIELNQDPPVNSCRPAADVLFQSAARVFGGHILAVVMTGMGTDGTEGIRTMKEKGCWVLSQAEDTCVVYGMPRAVDEAGLADEQVSLGDLAGRINALVKGGPS
jgi:two-component system chemotaxis response regulator CheB